MNLRKLEFRKRYLLIALLPILLVFGYWLKIQIGINIFDSFGISSYFPFKYFINHVIESPKPGILLEDDFNKISIIKKWSDLWMREDGRVTKELTADGIDGSKCLLIKNSSSGSWTYSHNKLVEVKPGDLFAFDGLVNIQGNNLSAYLSLAAFDENKKVIAWNFFKEKVNKTGTWVRVNKQIAISNDNIKYIQFRLVGVGLGEYRFDQIAFHKIK
jgi:hypothetical protein